MNSLSVIFTLGMTLICASVQAALSWCQHDDPAYVESERKRQKIASRDAYQVPCPQSTDPQTLPAQLTLPMPCGRRMVLRRVDIPIAHSLDHLQAYLGTVPDKVSADSAAAALIASINGPWQANISGAFRSGPQAQLKSFYYIGKYEVTEPQFELWRRQLLVPGKAGAAADDPACQDYRSWMEQQGQQRFRGTRVLPAVGLSWIEAVRFAYDYTEWLLALDRSRIANKEPPSLPWSESSPGFLRLPTEAEWELAARAGLASSAGQSQRLYQVANDEDRMPELPKLPEIASMRANLEEPPEHSEVFYIGHKQPNLLGIYDTIGNADEMVFDLFRPLRPDTLAGQRGGYPVKGGNAQTSAADAGVGYRQEVPFFHRTGPTRSPLSGFRLLLSAPVVTNKRGAGFTEELAGNPEQAKAFLHARQALLAAGGSPESVQQENTIAELKRLRLAQSAEKTELNSRLAAIQQRLEQSVAQLNDRDRRIAREQYESTVLMYANIQGVFARMKITRDSMEIFELDLKKYKDQPQGKRIEHALELGKKKLALIRLKQNANFEHYVQSIYNLAGKDPGAFKAAVAAVRDQFQRRGLKIYESALTGVSTHVALAQRAGGAVSQTQLDNWLKDIEESRIF